MEYPSPMFMAHPGHAFFAMPGYPMTAGHFAMPMMQAPFGGLPTAMPGGAAGTPNNAAQSPPSTAQRTNATPSASSAASKKKPILAKRFKTELCQSTIQGRACPYESRCMFAHGQDELRTAEQNLADGLTSEEAIKEWKINTAAAKRRGGHPSAPATPAAMVGGGAAAVGAIALPSVTGYTTVHPGQIVYLQGPDGALVPTPIASLCWPNGVPLLPLPGGLPVQQMPAAVKNTEPAALPRGPSPESSARSASSDGQPTSTPAASRLGVIGGRVFGGDSYTPTAPFLAVSLDELSHALAGAAASSP